MKKTIVALVIIAALLATRAVAQEKPAAAQTLDSSKHGAPVAENLYVSQAPQVSPQDRQAIADLQVRGVGYAQAIAVLQKELDAVNAEFGRLVQRLQTAQPGYDLTPQLTYVKKAEPKKDPPK